MNIGSHLGSWYIPEIHKYLFTIWDYINNFMSDSINSFTNNKFDLLIRNISNISFNEN